MIPHRRWEVYIEISRVLVVVASVGITAGLYAQFVKIWRSRSAEDFSQILVLALLLNELSWFNYGWALGEWPIILVGIVNLPAILGITVGYWRFHDG